MADIISKKNTATAAPGPPYADVVVARTLRNLKRFSGLLRPFIILPFRSYGCGNTVVICGRVIESLHTGAPQKDASWWRNLCGMAKMFLRARAEKANLTATLNGESFSITTDKIGYFHKEIVLHNRLDRHGWIDVDFVLDPLKGYRHIERQKGRIFSLSTVSENTIGIISDIDDTILESHATDLLKTAKMTFFNNSASRSAIAGMAELYDAIIHTAPLSSPVIYITSSSWSLHPMMTDFLKFQNFPDGPLLMQKIGVTNNKLIHRGHGHKTHKIEAILNITGSQRFFLFGDNGQADPQIYLDIASRYPDRISAVCIRFARERAKQYAADYTKINVPYFEFDSAYSLKKKLIEAGLLQK